MKPTALTISKLLKSKNQSLDKLQLQKLLYITFGFYSIITKNDDKYLFDDTIEAWRYGPVIPNVYAPSGFENVSGEEPYISDEVHRVIDFVCKKYKGVSGTKFINLTHQQGTPWSEVYQQGKNNEIPKELIVKYYFSSIGVLKFAYETGILDELSKT